MKMFLELVYRAWRGDKTGAQALGAQAKRRRFGLALAGLWLAFANASAAAPSSAAMKIMVWGALSNKPEWNRRLNVQASRQGCSSAPTPCVDSLAPIIAGGIHKLFLSIPFNPPQSTDYARQYSALSVSRPWLMEIGYDDFAAQYEKAATANGMLAARKGLQDAIAAVKASNPKLGFGITLYENELASPFLNDTMFPVQLRAQVNYVHFFAGYRLDAPAFASYLPQLRRMFPKARIIGGVYAYDRRDYVPCQANGEKCTVAQELALFTQGMKIEAQLLRSGQLDWLETTPGYFGREADIPDWKSDPRACQSDRVAQCIATSQELRRRMAAILEETAKGR
jgi:hypothetical protein